MPSRDQLSKKERIHEGIFIDNWYTRGCIWANNLVPSLSKGIAESRKKSRKRTFDESKKKIERMESKFDDTQKKYKSTDPRYRTMENKYKRQVDDYEKKKREYERDEFKRLLRFARFDIEPHEVITFGYVVMIIAIILMLVADFFMVFAVVNLNLNSDAYNDLDKNADGYNDLIQDVDPVYSYVEDPETGTEKRVLEGYAGDISLLKFVVFIIIPTLAIVFGSYTVIEDYPKNYAKRLRIQSLGTMPEAINYLVMSMHLNPSLDRAVDFAANNVSEPMSSNLKKMLWDVYMREHDSIEDAFVAFAYDWGEWNEDFKRSMYAIRSAVLERTSEGVHRTLGKANEMMLDGTKRQIESFAASLAGPTMTLFALGVLLPITLSAILPIAQVGMDYLFFIVLILDVLFPLSTAAYAYRILGMRPGTSVPPEVESPLTEFEKSSILIVSVLMVAGFVVLGYFTFTTAMALHAAHQGYGSIFALLGSMPFMWAITFPLSLYFYMTSRDQKKVRDMTLQMEREFPDALFQLGSRIAERKPIEFALRKVGQSMKGTMIAWTFRKISYSLQVTRSTLKNVLFGPEGILAQAPSTTIKASMRTVMDAVRKDPVTAGQTIIGISNYLRDLKNVEHEIRIKLGQTIDMMQSTATFFAPMIMGIVSAIYILLSRYLSGVDLWGGTAQASSVSPIPGDVFSLIIEIYLILTIVVIVYFCAGIRYGEDNVARKYMLSKVLPVATIIYSVSAVVAKIYIGGW